MPLGQAWCQSWKSGERHLYGRKSFRQIVKEVEHHEPIRLSEELTLFAGEPEGHPLARGTGRIHRHHRLVLEETTLLQQLLLCGQLKSTVNPVPRG